MSNNLKTFLFILLAVFLVSGGLIFMSTKSKKTADTGTTENGGVAGASTVDNTLNPENKDSSYIEKLAKFMTEKGLTMYGASWCSHCQAQKKAFGDAVKYIDYVECDASSPNANPEECKNVAYTDSQGKSTTGISGYPTWIYQGHSYEGEQSLSQLAQIVGFNDDGSTPAQ